MTKAWIVIFCLAAPLLATEAAYSEEPMTVDPMTQSAGAAESKDCGTEARRMEHVASDAPDGRKDRTPNAIYHAQLAERYAADGNDQACWSELGLAQNYLD